MAICFFPIETRAKHATAHVDGVTHISRVWVSGYAIRYMAPVPFSAENTPYEKKARRLH